MLFEVEPGTSLLRKIRPHGRRKTDSRQSKWTNRSDFGQYRSDSILCRYRQLYYSGGEFAYGPVVPIVRYLLPGDERNRGPTEGND